MSQSNLRRRAAIVALTSGTGVTLLGLYCFAPHLVRAALTNWPPLNSYTLLGLALGLSGLCFNLHQVYKAYQEGDQRQQRAIAELQQRIVDRLRDVNSPFLTANSLRGLALGIEQKHRSATLTDSIIAEAIRAAALHVEDHRSGAALRRRMLLLNEALQTLDSEQPGLLSVATLDRIDAYRQSGAVAVIMALTPMLLIATRIPLLCWMGVSFTGIAFALLFLSSLRAELYWKYDDGSRIPFLFRLLRPSRPRMPFDFVIVICTSRKRWVSTFWHLAWAPLWETIPIFLRYGRDPEKIELMHRFRFPKARRLYKRLRKMQREKDLLPPGQGDRATELLSPDWEKGFRSLCRELWVVTGESMFRDMEEYRDMSIPLASQNKALIKLLL